LGAEEEDAGCNALSFIGHLSRDATGDQSLAQFFPVGVCLTETFVTEDITAHAPSASRAARAAGASHAARAAGASHAARTAGAARATIYRAVRELSILNAFVAAGLAEQCDAISDERLAVICFLGVGCAIAALAKHIGAATCAPGAAFVFAADHPYGANQRRDHK
jgi:hypothetical protein